MSGLEVVGVVLGAIPLIISAIEKYKTTSKRLKYARHKEALVNDLIQRLQEQHYFVKRDLTLTLRLIHCNDGEIEDLLSNPSSRLFLDTELALEVQHCLKEGFTPYIAALSRCEYILMKLAQEINGLASNQSALSSLLQANPPKDGTYEFTRRIKFALAREDMERQIAGLDNATTNLQRIRDYQRGQSEISPPSISRAVTKITSYFEGVAEHARRLYSAIAMGYVGHCHSEHEAQLFLQPRTELMDNPRALKKAPLVFTVAFGSAMPGSCHKAEVEIMQDEPTYCEDRLPLKQRMSLALSAVSSVLQLNFTPWLSIPLTSGAVYLISEDPRTVRPFIKQKFIAQTSMEQQYNVRRTMLELGILLLELWHEQTLASFAAEAQMPIYNSLGSREEMR
ncbi:hypothetical protein N7457_006640 [Penicillium paradoxum]|uniref:uncharacterized protein n=1 Tax=Penicillium paradoxum TaxID=176176 RepID=UPI00254955B5|nr:uncharacterized protein N7457_006640 [Penicillium paradoxum]KAJ5778920.1 hypothetical protein N7457_006640 [Penicillium paradoxum]